MQLSISNSSDKPLYEQLYVQIKSKIMSGELKEGEALPTIRSLARALKNQRHNHVAAYGDLERDGYINTVVGKGSFVAARNEELFREENLRRMEEKLSEAVEIARMSGISDGEIRGALDLLLGD